MSRLILIDESLEVGNKTSRPSFYLLAVGIVSEVESYEIRQMLKEEVNGTYWHSTEALRSENGRLKLALLCEIVRKRAVGSLYVHAPLISGDKLGEATRKKLILEALGTEILEDYGDRVVLEARLRGYQQDADRRTLNEVQKRHPNSNLQMRMHSPEEDVLLWLPDVIATAYRQYFLFQNETYWERIAEVTRVIAVK